MTSGNEYLLKLCILGSHSKLRENFSRTHAENKFDTNYLPTIGADITTKKIMIGTNQLKLILVDTAGTEFFGKLRPSYYRGSSGGILVYDKKIIEEDERDQVKQQIKAFYKTFRTYVDPTRVPVAIVGDIKQPMTQGATSKKDGDFGIKPKINTHYYEIDSSVKEQVMKIWSELAEVVISKAILQSWERKNLEPMILQNNREPEVKKCSVVEYWGEKTLGYCAYNCDELSKVFLDSYNDVHPERFQLFPPEHLSQCLHSCPLFSLLVDQEQVKKFQQNLQTFR